jgi:hypothetical protein
MLKYSPCRNIKQKARKRDSVYCWTCGHYTTCLDNRCDCCYGTITRPKKHEKILEIKTEIDSMLNELDNHTEYRFYINGWVCWITKKDLDEYRKLDTVEKHDRFYHYIKSLIETDRLARVIH